MKVTTAKARERMAREVETLCAGLGISCERDPDLTREREICLNIKAAGGLRVSVSLDGASREESEVMPWHMATDSDNRLSEAFGSEMAASVNPHHRRKCTAVAPDFQSVLWKLKRGIEMAADGSAFMA